ncbi:hypothetical protein [Psychrobacter sp. NPDC078761]|uniref:hypothetical protein n=1 Tax=Psychrobacter sp. NPDC078761 TaxID=3390668 RepID=UPI003D00F986
MKQNPRRKIKILKFIGKSGIKDRIAKHKKKATAGIINQRLWRGFFGFSRISDKSSPLSS